MTNAQSPIQQQIIDGVFYWDSIGPDWNRLLERETQDVIGHYRREYSDSLWRAVANTRYHASTGARDQRTFATAEQAREWIEQNAKDNWGNA